MGRCHCVHYGSFLTITENKYSIAKKSHDGLERGQPIYGWLTPHPTPFYFLVF